MVTKCKSLIRLYGGHQKDQRQNYALVPRGTLGQIVNSYVDVYGTAIALCKFNVDNKRVWVRCAPTLLEVA